MTLLDLINSQKKNTTVKITFIQLISIIGLSLEYMKI